MTEWLKTWLLPLKGGVGGVRLRHRLDPCSRNDPICPSNDFFSRSLQQCEDKWGHLCALADFSLALTESIQEINKHSFNNFELRIGE